MKKLFALALLGADYPETNVCARIHFYDQW